jgi:hypothetical protein
MNRTASLHLLPLLRGTALRRGAIFGSILLSALLAFEVFNYSTTSFALHDLLGDLQFAGIRWSTILAIAFCGIDFAGIARIFTPEQGRDEPIEIWYLFGAWLLAAGMNATLTWWGVSVAIVNHTAAGSVLLGQQILTKAVPVFVAIMVWLIRVLIIGTFSVAGERLFTLAEDQPTPRPTPRPSPQPQTAAGLPLNQPQPLPRQVPAMRPEPTYHPVGMSARPAVQRPAIKN